MSWKKPALSDGPSTTAADEELQLAWKRPRLALQEDNRSTAVTGKSWKKLSVSSVSSSLFRGSGGAGAGANHLVWHSVSVDEPTLSLIKCEDTPMTEYKKMLWTQTVLPDYLRKVVVARDLVSPIFGQTKF